MSVQDRADRQGRVGPFVTFVERVRPDGAVARWESRRHRKHPQGAPATGSTWWAPRARGWWIAVLFAVGSLLFALGAVPGYASAVGARWDAVTFFVGSLFFTAAGFLTYREAVDASPQAPGAVRRRFFVFQPRRIDWWATAVQLVGTLYFNISTGNAMRVDLTAQAAHQHARPPTILRQSPQRSTPIPRLPPGSRAPIGSRCVSSKHISEGPMRATPRFVRFPHTHRSGPVQAGCGT